MPQLMNSAAALLLKSRKSHDGRYKMAHN